MGLVGWIRTDDPRGRPCNRYGATTRKGTTVKKIIFFNSYVIYSIIYFTFTPDIV